MQPVNTGGPVVGRHYGSEYLLSFGDGSRSRVGYLNVLLPDGSGSLLVQAVLGLEAGPLLLASMFGEVAFFERIAQSDAEGVLLVGELVDEVTGVAPEREVGL